MDTAAFSPGPAAKRQRVGSPGNSLKAHQPVGRCCFVTVGATAGFRSLLDEVTTAQFFDCLAKHGYTSLQIQCGPDHAAIEERIASLSDEEKHGISVLCFQYTDAMTTNILNCRGLDNVRPAGCVISHGGTGTIGEVLGIGAPLIVVPNPTLMDNHQLELAETLEAQKLVVHGHIGSMDAAIHCIADRIAQGTLDALPPYCPPPFPVPAADRVTFFDWMVLTCYPDEFAAQMRAADLGLAEAEFAAKQQQQYQQLERPTPSAPAAAIDTQKEDSMLQFD
ncbi:glycosyltransferase family 1 protein [Chaetomium sp. MPI-CAGE-AT-0009]|nr:glycosyltransferase family 1 protein [Chaetomium sp. MPI-CAGE-AT-0009]